jgi:hypothetical protein
MSPLASTDHNATTGEQERCGCVLKKATNNNTQKQKHRNLMMAGKDNVCEAPT